MRTILFLAIAAFALHATAQTQPSAYPAQGQSAEQKGADDQACHTWAKTDTGIDRRLRRATRHRPAGRTPGGRRARCRRGCGDRRSGR